MKVRMTFFKTSGKYYSEAIYESLLVSDVLDDYFDEVREMRGSRDDRTGLHSGGFDFYCVVDFPNNPNAYPRLLLPQEVKRKYEPMKY